MMYEFEECETAYNTARGVECYNRFKDKTDLYVHPLSTGITYALIPKGTEDHIAIISSGYGRADASDGRVFPWVFTVPTNYWSQNTAKIKWIAQQMGRAWNKTERRQDRQPLHRHPLRPGDQTHPGRHGHEVRFRGAALPGALARHRPEGPVDGHRPALQGRLGHQPQLGRLLHRAAQGSRPAGLPAGADPGCLVVRV